MQEPNHRLISALKALLKPILLSPPTLFFFLPLSQVERGFNKSAVTGDIVSVGQRAIKMKLNVWVTLCYN